MSWEQLVAIRAEVRAIAREQEAQPPVACPNDGEPLLAAPDGTLFCRFDGFRWPGER